MEYPKRGWAINCELRVRISIVRWAFLLGDVQEG